LQTALERDLEKSWATCFDLLPKVSRTFALSIMGLKEPLRGSVCVSYLMCRILDTIEDAPEMEAAHRWALMEPFLASLASGGELPPEWYRGVSNRLRPRSAPFDYRLLESAKHVLRCFKACDASSRLAMTRWVTEMGKGMVAWSERMGDGPGILKTLPSLVALDRYCYYIAGTVGYLLTDLFYINSPAIDVDLYFKLQADAEAFGLGLQKVNIVKDLADDFRRGWCFVPAVDLRSQELVPCDVLDESKGAEVYQAVRPVLSSAAEHLARAWRYLTHVPLDEKEIRLFLAYSLFFALRTLALVADAPAALVRPAKLKISRLEVARLVAECNKRVSRPEALEGLYLETAAPLAAFGTGGSV
jgi:farnesyl-diphosphate farnesyltransferase